MFPLARVLHPGVYFISHPPAHSNFFFWLVYFLFFKAVQNMLQVPAAATVATAQATGPRSAESPCLPPRTGAASIIQAVPQLIDPGQEVLPTEAQSDRGDDVLFSQLSEFSLLVCRLHHTFLQNVLSRLRSIGGSTVLILLCFLTMVG